MKKTLIVILTAVAVVGLSMATTCFYLGRCHPRHDITSGLVGRDWLAGLDLSEEQKKQLEPVEAALQKDLNAIQQKLTKERMAICDILRSEKVDPMKLESFASHVSTVEAQQQRRVIQHLLDVRKVLTREQNQKLYASIMHEICQACQASTGTHDCLCGMCEIEHTKKG